MSHGVSMLRVSCSITKLNTFRIQVGMRYLSKYRWGKQMRECSGKLVRISPESGEEGGWEWKEPITNSSKCSWKLSIFYCAGNQFDMFFKSHTCKLNLVRRLWPLSWTISGQKVRPRMNGSQKRRWAKKEMTKHGHLLIKIKVWNKIEIKKKIKMEVILPCLVPTKEEPEGRLVMRCFTGEPAFLLS